MYKESKNNKSQHTMQMGVSQKPSQTQRLAAKTKRNANHTTFSKTKKESKNTEIIFFNGANRKLSL